MKLKKKLIIVGIIFILVITGIILYSRYISTKGLIVREYKIIDSKITDDYYGTKIIHFSDIHYGRITFDKELKEVVKQINSLKPDIVVFTGDLIDKDTQLNDEMTESLVNILTSIDSKLGKFAIKGEDDDNFASYESIIKKANFTYLKDSYELIYNNEKPILIAGFNNTDLTIINEYISSNETIYNILLVHEPDKILEMEYSNFDLILAGHSHNGQIKLPFIGPVLKENGSKKYYNDYYKVNNTNLYISGGIGTSKINFRFNVKPSFNLYRLVNK